MQVVVCAHGGQRTTAGVVPQVPSTFLGDRVSQLAWNSLSRIVAGQWVLRSPVPAAPALGL